MSVLYFAISVSLSAWVLCFARMAPPPPGCGTGALAMHAAARAPPVSAHARSSTHANMLTAQGSAAPPMAAPEPASSPLHTEHGLRV